MWNNMALISPFLLLLMILTSLSKAEIVQVHMVRDHLSTGSCQFPPHFTARISSTSYNLLISLSLTRSDITHTSNGVVLMSTDEKGEAQFDREDIHHRSQGYQAVDMSAAFTATCHRDKESDQYFFLLDGSFFQQRRKYILTPVGDSVTMTTTAITTMYSMKETQEYNRPGDHDFIVSESLKPKVDNAKGPLEKAQSIKDINRQRHKRTTTEYILDILPVIDFSLYKLWLTRNNNDNAQTTMAISNYYKNLFTSINMRLSTLRLANSVHLKVAMLDPHLSTTASTSPYTEDIKEAATNGQFQVNASRALQSFRSWIADSSGLPAHDHAMMFTSLFFYGGADGGKGFNITKGLAYVGSICQADGDSSSIVEDRGNYQSEGVAAHELGHSLGSLHDGQDNGCHPSNRLVMSDGTYPLTQANAGNSWRFSTCSSSYISATLSDLETTSLLNSCLMATSGQIPDLTTTKNINDQCKANYDDTSFFCRGSNFRPLNESCDDFFCRQPGTALCSRFYTAAGTCCGNGKFCLDGQCVTSPQDTCVMDESCPFGDQPGIVTEDGRTCSQLSSASCYNAEIRIKCCATCKKRATGRAGCEYGDKQLGCQLDSCGGTLASGLSYQFICCDTCPPTNCFNLARLSRDGREYSCDEFLDRFGNHHCYATLFHVDACCQSCEKRRGSNIDCPYGDNLGGFAPNRCDALPATGRTCSAAESQLCCETCPTLPTRGPTTESTQRSTSSTRSTSSSSSSSSTSSTQAATTSSTTECVPGNVCSKAALRLHSDFFTSTSAYVVVKVVSMVYAFSVRMQ